MDWFYIVPTITAVVVTFGLIVMERSRGRAHASVYYVATFVRSFFGAHLLFSGLRFYVGAAQPVITDPLAGPFLASLTAMGIFPAVKLSEVVIGACLLANLLVPVTLILEFPSTVVIFYMNTFITHTPRTLITGPLELLTHLVLFGLYFGYYRDFLVVRAPLRPVWNAIAK
jgi:hypothetical protein